MVGICLNWGFMGVLAVQTYIYHLNFPNDTRAIKALVYGLVLLDMLQTGMVTADAFHWFVFGFGNMKQLDDTFLNSWDVPMLDAIVSLIVQSFYSWRIYILRRSFIFPVIIGMISLCQCGAGIAVAVQVCDTLVTLRTTHFLCSMLQAHKLGHLSLISTEVGSQTTWLVGATVADVSITAVLSWTLLRSRGRVHENSRGMINRIVSLTVETNSITALTAVIALILFLGVPQHSTLVVPPTAIMGKLYTNCLIAVLNNRQIKTPYGTTNSTSIRSYTAPRSNRPQDIASQVEGQEGLQVQVVKNFELKHDSDFELSNMDRKVKLGQNLETGL
ncbi:hypothetical protein BDZ97DRAFT_1821207 [Flammula alnicola]|nr:hypothetical protein BDZ97DRAFT_1821207 [Flammula alnicola]